MRKTAKINPQHIKYLGRILAGAGIGGAAGRYATPHLFGYSDVPEARRVSALSDAVLGGTLAALGGPSQMGEGQLKAISRGFRELPSGLKTLTTGGIPLAEMGPLMVAKLTKERESAERMQDAARNAAEAANAIARSSSESANTIAQSSIPAALSRLASSPTAKGVGAGAAIAGLGGLATGFTRRRTKDETRRHADRGSMVTRDFMRYALPAMAAGGVIGSLANRDNTQA